jgi:integrase
MKPSIIYVKVAPDIRRTKEESKFPLKLRITFKGARKYYGTGFDATDGEWDSINSDAAKGKLRNIKKALNIEDIKEIFKYETEPFTTIDQAKDFWIFSYLCNGINFMDIAHLRWSEVQDEKIVFERSKTKRTKRDNPIKIIALRDQYLNTIIKKWGSRPDPLRDKFVFEIIHHTDDSKRARAKVQQFTKVVNEWLKVIGDELNLPIKLTTYVARHSFATMLVRGGAPLAFASQLCTTSRPQRFMASLGSYLLTFMITTRRIHH